MASARRAGANTRRHRRRQRAKPGGNNGAQLLLFDLYMLVRDLRWLCDLLHTQLLVPVRQRQLSGHGHHGQSRCCLGWPGLGLPGPGPGWAWAWAGLAWLWLPLSSVKFCWLGLGWLGLGLAWPGPGYAPSRETTGGNQWGAQGRPRGYPGGTCGDHPQDSPVPLKNWSVKCNLPSLQTKLAPRQPECPLMTTTAYSKQPPCYVLTSPCPSFTFEVALQCEVFFLREPLEPL